MKLIKQPKGSVYCGHCSMAMILNSSMETMIEEVGVNTKQGGGSTIRMYYAYFDKKGIKYDAIEFPDNRKKLDLSGRGVISITNKSRNWGHAMAFEDGVIYDPDGSIDEYAGIAEMKRHYKKFVPTVYVYSIVRLLEEEL